MLVAFDMQMKKDSINYCQMNQINFNDEHAFGNMSWGF